MSETTSDGTVRAVTHALMRELGMDTVFGNPGSTEMKFFRDWPADFRYVLALQESCAVAMADGWAQHTRCAAFVNLHSAAGVGHALGSVFTAYTNHTPLVITAGQQTRAMFPTDPYLYAAEATAFPKPYVKWSVEPARAEDVPAAIQRAYHVAMQRPRGPVFVSVPEDDWDAIAVPLSSRRVETDVAPSTEAIGRLADLLRDARTPVVVAGAGVDQDAAWDDLLRLVERLGAPVWASPMSGRCSFPEDHPLFAGFLPPLRQPLADRLAGHDVVLVLGAPVFTYHVHTGGEFVKPGTQLVQITDDPRHAARSAVGDSLVGSVRLALRMLVDALGQGTPTSQRGRAPRPVPAAGRPMSGAYLMAAIARLMPRDAVIVEEAPTHREVLHDHLPVTTSGGFYAGASGGLGWAIAAAVGVALAEPRRKVICLVGDGSALFSIQALWTAAQHRLPIAFVVLNNAGYGALKSFASIMRIADPPGTELPGVDFVSIARGFGCTATRVEDPADLDAALRSAFESSGCCLVDVALDPGVKRLY
jgi:benzoylformate decarboxylase